MRLAVYSDYSYRHDDGTMWAEVAFVRFLVGLAPHLEHLTLVGRLDPQPGRWHHRVPTEVGFEPLPYYRTLANPAEVARTFLASLRRFRKLLSRVDAVWLLGPHPLALAFAVLALLSRKPVTLGVRQDLAAYMRNRRSGARGLRLASVLLEAAFRLLGRRCAVVVVGADLAQRYRRSRRLLAISVSLVSGRDFAPVALSNARSWNGQIQVLSVGRLDPEKNPLLLAEVLARLDERWRLVVCGEGSQRAALEGRLTELGVRERADLVGYVPVEGGLLDLYRRSHVLLHCSWTEGVPQVLYEAFAQRLPIVATDVGGVRDATDGAALLVPPGDAEACAGALETLVEDASLRERLVEAGLVRARDHSLEAETERVARFLTATLASRR